MKEANQRETSSFTSRKYKRKRGPKKLLRGDKVEVRSFEDGFLGSWHSGTVIALEKYTRRVRYDHLLVDESGDNLIDTVAVSKVIEGIKVADTTYSDGHRGCIRPPPPKLEFSKWDLRHGLCVDVYFRDAWWEGVIFDHEDGSEERKVFFPDLGDEMSSGINSFRITQDWDELTETWHRRGTWLFLELIEEHQKENFIPVSLKQLWYDVRDKTGFEKIGEWTCSKRLLWEDLVLQLIQDNVIITTTHFLQEFDAPGPSQLEIEPSLKASDEHSNYENNGFPKSVPSMSFDLIPVQNLLTPGLGNADLDSDKIQTRELKADGQENLSNNNEAESQRPQDLSVSPSAMSNSKAITHSCARNWEPVDLKIVPEAQFCPHAVLDYVKKASRENVKNARKHLKHMGWSMEHMTDETGKHRIRYISPDGRQIEHSLRQVCLGLMKKDKTPGSPMVEESFCLTYEQARDKTRETEEKCRLGLPSDATILDDDNEQSVKTMEAYLKTKKEDILKRDPKAQTIKLKVKKHLSANGWAFSKKIFGNRWFLQYKSPTGICVYTLKEACRKYLQSLNLEKQCRRLKNVDGTVKEKLNSFSFSEVSAAQAIQKLKRKRKSDSPRFGTNSVRKEMSSDFRNGNLDMRHGKRSRISKEMSDGINSGKGTTRVLRSSKRLIQAATPCSKNKDPRTVLSWLIDNNVVPPREKVYCGGKDCSTGKQGKITRDGIKCGCCSKIFTTDCFALHAGRKYPRPAGKIFLEDGRSLLDCQIEANKAREKAELHDVPERKWCQGENDDVCSVCLYGGDLILCDGCPSSFHKSCIGLEDLPHGDWFCPSCCCGTCEQVNPKEDSTCSKQDQFVSCYQCERKYHVWCLPNQGADNMSEKDKHQNWFCNKDCREIFVNLQKLIGKREVVGSENLTWTLMKPLKSDSSELYPSDVEVWAENHSKLSAALGVMHECFEPVKDAQVRDLVEDVIFSKSSKLKRLNFRGFYTILLERNDELITVATIRVCGKSVAEVPLIATRFQYRRLGMCRILMDEFEKKLMQLGVERLVLPAVPSVLSTWTDSFGFLKMTASERRSFLRFTFLDFQDTVMCQKLLTQNPLPYSISSTGDLPERR